MTAQEHLEVEVTDENGVAVVAINGPVDSATMNEFQEALEPLFRKKAAHVLIDCEGLTYINSRAIGMLTKYRRKVYTQGGRLALCNIDSKIVRTLDLLGLNKVLRRYPSREDALAGMS